METLSFEFPAGQPARGKALVGVVGSGDLEVLLATQDAGEMLGEPVEPDPEEETVEILIIDFSEAFWEVPLRVSERGYSSGRVNGV